MGGDRFLHMFGALREVIAPSRADYELLDANVSEYGGTTHIREANSLINRWDAAAQDLKVIDPHTKNLGSNSDNATAIMQKARSSYFLGFGFDQENVKRLGLPHKLQEAPHRSYYFTNFGDRGSVNKLAAKAFAIKDIGRSSGGFFTLQDHAVEKSVRDCYHALALDFGTLAEIV